MSVPVASAIASTPDFSPSAPPSRFQTITSPASPFQAEGPINLMRKPAYPGPAGSGTDTSPHPTAPETWHKNPDMVAGEWAHRNLAGPGEAATEPSIWQPERPGPVPRPAPPPVLTVLGPLPKGGLCQPVLLLGLGLLAGLLPALAACPQNCHCHGDLQHVICDKVGLQKIPKVSEKTKLLNLQRNNFPVLAANSFRATPNLVSLHLQHCQIREVAAGAFRGLKQLIYLYLSHNDIRVLRAGAFDDLTELTYLYLDHNKVTELPRGLLSPLVNLFILQLNNNKIRELRPGAFQGTKDLRWLYLSENALSSLQPGSLDDVENLAKFHVDKNQLSSYPSAALSKLRVVEELKLSHNPLKSIPDNAFQSFGRYLETLWLDNTNLEKFSDGAFLGVTTLKHVHLENNRLNQLPSNFPFDNLETLTLTNNPWKCTCQLRGLRRWLEAKASRPDATCASPAKFRGQHIRDTDAFRSCKFPTKRSKKAGRH
ncbi:chondroadherin [Carlito syrichta]|uniref:Chondroadherin n=1 Tax=Carlito syrichta TaxID=1868482 RepID=A0A1U7SR70_CARSF|nr:chondroadherin [Carlito syrichta]